LIVKAAQNFREKSKIEKLKVGKGGLPPPLEWHSMQAGQATLPDPEVFLA
jgi:hypothetical protein